LPERAGRLRALRGGIRRGPGLQARPSSNRPFAVRKADGVARRGRALQSRKTRARSSIAFASSSDPPDRREPGPAITHLPSEGRTAPRAAGARCKAKRHAPAIPVQLSSAPATSRPQSLSRSARRTSQSPA